MKTLIFTLFLLTVTCHGFKDYDGYKTFRVWPQSKEQMNLLNILSKYEEYDFWTKTSRLTLPVDIMVAPSNIDGFEHLMNVHHFNSTILINNVAKTLHKPTKFQPKDVNSKIGFTQYQTLQQIQDYLRNLASSFPNLVTLFSLGKTYEGNDILGVKISTGGTDKPVIYVDSGIHAREWMAHAMGLYIINQLVENEENHQMIENIDWYIVPVLNPDGYVYTHEEDRFWRKNRSPGTICRGTDLNRNYGFHWMEVGASSSQCSETFAGKSGFSEKETSQMRDYVLNTIGPKNIKLYLTFHSYGQYLLYPWGYTSSLPSNWRTLDALAQDVNKAIMSVRGTEYTVGSSTNVLYAAAGGGDDWMMSVGVPLTYTIELPGGGSGGFNPPPSSITPIVTETFEGVKVYANFVANNY